MLLGLSLVVVSLGLLVRPGYGGSTEDKTVKLCHRPPGNPTNVEIKEFRKGSSAEEAHLKHGDTYVATFYQDADADGYGTPLSTIEGCKPPKGFVTNNTDCDDTDPDVNPGAEERVGNGIDDDCNPTTSDVICPCDNQILISRPGTPLRWDALFSTESCRVDLFGGIVLFELGSMRRRELLVSGSDGICALRDGISFNDLRIEVTEEQAAACVASLRSIALADGITCP
jgi:hypothetical protein